MIAQQWPRAGTIAAAIRGDVSEVINVGTGNVRGLRSAYPWITFILQPLAKHVVLCDRCEEGDTIPDPPEDRNVGGERVGLLAPGTSTHALFVLTWLNRFARKHNDCLELVECEARTEE